MLKRAKLIGFFVCIILIFTSGTTVFADSSEISEDDSLDDIIYSETIIEDFPHIQLFSTTKTKTCSKIAQAKTGSGTILWYVKVTGTFKYNGSTSSCINSTVVASAPASTWSIKSKKASKNGSTAKATATAVQKIDGTTIKTLTKSVSIKCSKNGTLS